MKINYLGKYTISNRSKIRIYVPTYIDRFRENPTIYGTYFNIS